ncbi:hypothetical protein L6R53_27530 [Myxococcota bacterium]|nr:hypothetical protein [Myxococcota bacterium]
MIHSLVLALSLLACKDDPELLDGDGDGYDEEVDCNDADAATSPAAAEVCDYLDNDCDGLVDEQDPDLVAGADDLFFGDADGDGYGHWESWTIACEAPEGFADNAADCDDADPDISPDADEVCDGIDNDCSGGADDDAVDATTWYLDGDGDGYGVDDAGVLACDEPDGATDLVGDCDDADASVSPGQQEVCNDGIDNDCDEAAADRCAADLGVADLAIRGAASFDEVGISVVGLGDLDGDGHEDLGLGARSYDLASVDAGAAFVQYGPIAADGEISLADLDLALLGAASADKAGRDLAAGDLDGDGQRDLVVSAPNADQGGQASGTVHVVLGGLPKKGSASLADADVQIWGEATYDYLGVRLQVVDADGDGQDDLLIGASGSDLGPDNAGAVYLLSGPLSAGDLDLEVAGATASWAGAGNADSVGLEFDGACDLDGDGARDLLVGAGANDTGGSEAGAIYLLSGMGAGDGSVSDALFTLRGAASEQLGSAVSCVADMDGDGVDDLAVGQAGRDGTAGQDVGAAHLLAGGVGLAKATGTVDDLAFASVLGAEDDDQLGADLSAAGDHDGDGHADLLVGATNAGEGNAGAAYLFLGPLSGALEASAADARYMGQRDGDHAGYVVRFVGDVGGLGGDALGIGAIDADGDTTAGGVSDAGALWLVLATGL